MALLKNITSGSINGIQITGSLDVSNGITGSLFGTASWALNAVSSSWAPNSLSGGATNYIPLWSSATALTSSIIYQTTSSNILIGTTTDSGYKLDVSGTTRIQDNFTVSGIVSLHEASGIYTYTKIKAKSTQGAQDIFTIVDSSEAPYVVMKTVGTFFDKHLYVPYLTSSDVGGVDRNGSIWWRDDIQRFRTYWPSASAYANLAYEDWVSSNFIKNQTSSLQSAQFWISGKAQIGGASFLNIYTLDVSGSGRFTNGLTVTGSLNVTGSALAYNLYSGYRVYLSRTDQGGIPNSNSGYIEYNSGNRTAFYNHTNAFGDVQATNFGLFAGGGDYIKFGYGSIQFGDSSNKPNTGIWGNVSIDSNTFAGYKLDVNGNARISSSITSYSDATINTLRIGLGNSSIASNTAIGYQSLNVSTTGNQNVALGYQSLVANTTGYNNTALGYQSLLNTSVGFNNVSIGSGAAQALTSGSDNIAIGVVTLNSTTTGVWNTAVGRYAASTGNPSYTTAIGGQALQNSTGSFNVGVGLNAGYQITTGTYNTILGSVTGYGIISGSYNTILGANIQSLPAGLNNTIIIGDGQGNQRIYVSSSGNVGIGTTTPYYKLDVSGSGRYTNGLTVTGSLTTTNDISLTVGGVTKARITGSTGRISAGPGGIYWTRSDGSGITDIVGMYYNTNNRLYYTGADIELNANSKLGSFPGAGNGVGLQYNYGILQLMVNDFSTEVARALNSGNFLIGTTTDAGYKLDVNGNTRTSRLGIGTTVDLSTYYFDYNGGNARWQLGGGTMRISGGYLAIQRTSSDLGIYLSSGILSINGGQIDGYSGGQAETVTIRGGKGDSGIAVGIILDNNTSLTTAGAKITSFRNATAEKAYIDKDGGLWSSGSGTFRNGLTITGSLTVSGSSTLTNIGPAIFSGSLIVTQGITGSLQGTASWANNALTASYVTTAVDTQVLFKSGNNITGSPFLTYDNTSNVNKLLVTGSQIILGIGEVIGYTAPAAELGIYGNSYRPALNLGNSNNGTRNLLNFINYLGATQSFFDREGSFTALGGNTAPTGAIINLAGRDAVGGIYMKYSNNAQKNLMEFQAPNGGINSLITYDGRFVINSSTDAGYKLDVNGTTRIQNNFTVTTGYGSFSNSMTTNTYGVKVSPDWGSSYYGAGPYNALLIDGTGTGLYGLYTGANYNLLKVSSSIGNSGNGIFRITNNGTVFINNDLYTLQQGGFPTRSLNGGYTLLDIYANNFSIYQSVDTDLLAIYGTGLNSYGTGATGKLRLLRIQGGSREGISVSAAGNVGFGVVNPLYNVHISGSTNLTGSLDVNGTSRFTNNMIITGSVTSTSFTGSLFGTSSWATNALTASIATSSSYALSASWAPGGGVSGGNTNYIPLWSSSTTLTSSIMLQTGSNVVIGATSSLASNYKLQVRETTGNNGILISTPDSYPRYLDFYSDSFGTVGYFLGTFKGIQYVMLSNGSFSIVSGANPIAYFYGNTQNTILGGTTDAGYKLDVNGTSRFTNTMIVTGSIYSHVISGAGSILLNGGDTTSLSFNSSQIAFSYNLTRQYNHFIRTRHNSVNSLNAIDFFVCDGTANNTLTSGVVHALSLNSGKVGMGGNQNPTTTLDVSGSGNFTNGLTVTGSLNVTGSSTILGGLVAPLVFNTITGSYTIVSADQGKMIEVSSSADEILTIPSSSVFNFPIGTEITIMQMGVGSTTVTGSAGVTVNSVGGLKLIATQYEAASIVKRATDTWYLFGNLS